MSLERELTTARTLLKAAHEAAEVDEGVFVHLEGIGKLEVRSVERVDEDTGIATVRCWPTDASSSNTWLVPLTSVKAVELNPQA